MSSYGNSNEITYNMLQNNLFYKMIDLCVLTIHQLEELVLF